MKKLQLINEGKGKRVYATDDPNVVLISYKDEAVAFNGLKRATITNKGVLSNRINNLLMQMLEKNGVPTHFIEEIADRESLMKKVEMLPLEIVVRNMVAGSLAGRIGLPEGSRLKKTILEFCYKNEELGDPMVNEYHITAMGWATEKELKQIADYCFKIDKLLSRFLKQHGIELIDFRLEFGKTADGTLVLADEISPDTARFWDAKTHEKMDKDRFRRDMGGVEDAYQEILHRLLED